MADSKQEAVGADYFELFSFINESVHDGKNQLECKNCRNDSRSIAYICSDQYLQKCDKLNKVPNRVSETPGVRPRPGNILFLPRRDVGAGQVLHIILICTVGYDPIC